MNFARILSVVSDGTKTWGTRLDELSTIMKQKKWRQSSVIDIGVNGQSLQINSRKGTSDYQVIWQCFKTNQYEIPVVWQNDPIHRQLVDDCYKKTLDAGRTPLVLDLGANIGASALWFKLRFPGAKIIAVEPSKSNCEQLRRNVSTYPDISVLEAGVGKSEAKMYLGNATGGAWGYRVSQVETDEVVQMTTIDALLERFLAASDVPFILKIDIEGSEKDVFSGPTDGISRFPLIVVEPHDYCMPGQSVSTPFFAFHSAANRDFLFGAENIFSLDIETLRSGNVS